MKRPKHTDIQFGKLSICTSGIITAAVAFLAFLGWLFHLPLLTNYGVSLVPMAPSTAVSFILMGIMLLLRSCMPQNRGAYFLSISIALLVAITGLLLLSLSWMGIYSTIEHIGFSITESLNGIAVGHMSPATAILFVACALGFLLTLSQSYERSKRAWTALILASLVILTSLLFLIAYLFVSPLMYGRGVIPPSLPTAIAFLFLAIGLLLIAALQIWPSSKIKDTATARVSYILFFIFILLAAGIVTGGYYAYHNYEKNYRGEIEHQLSAIADMKVNQIEAWRKERLGDGKILHKNILLSNIVKRYIQNKNDHDAQADILSWIGQLQRAYSYDLIMLLDARLNPILVYPEQKEQTRLIVDQKNIQILQAGEIVFKDLYRNDQDQHIYLEIIIPLLEGRPLKRLIGVIVLRINPDDYLYPILNKWPTPSRTSETLIIRREGNDVLFLSNLKYRDDAALNFRIPLASKDVPAVKAALGQEGIVEGTDYRGVPVVANIRAITDSPWYLIARMDIDEVYSPLGERLWLIVYLIGALLVGTGASVGFLWRQQRSRFYQEQYKSAEAVSLSEQQLKSYIDNAGDAIYVMEAATGRILNCNECACRMLGYTKEELLQLSAADIEAVLASSDVNAINSQIDQSEVKTIDGSHKRKDGTIFPVEIRLSSLAPAQPGILIGIVRDVTERKIAEETVRESERKFRKTFDVSPVGIVMVDLHKIFIRCNNAFSRMLCYSSEELIGKTIDDVTFSEDRDIGMADMAAIIKGEINSSNVQKRYIRKDGQIIWSHVTISLVRDSEERPQYFLAIIQDITDRKQAEELILKNKKQLEEAQRVGCIGSWNWDVVANNAECSDELYRIFDLDKNLSKFTIEKFFSIPHPDDRKMVEGIVMRSLQTNQSTDFEFRIKTGDEQIRWVQARSTVLLDEKGQLNHVFGTVQDITERKRVGEELKKSQEVYRSIFENTGNATMIVDENTIIILANDECLSATGYSPENLIGTSWTKYVAPDSLEQMKRNSQLRYQNPASVPNRYDVHLINAKGEIRDATLSIGLIPTTRQLVVSMLDITERTRAEAALAEETTRRRILFEQSPDGIVIIDPETAKFIEFNTSAHKQLGYSREEFAKLSVSDVEANETKSETRATISRAIKERRIDFETLQRTKQGEIRNVLVTAQYIDVLDRPVYQCIWRDITARKQADEELRKSEASLASAQARAHLGSWELDLNLQTGFWSNEMYKLFGRDPGSGVPALPDFLSYVHPDDRELIGNSLNQSITEKRPYYDEYRIVLSDGNVRWIEGQGEPVFDSNGTMTHFVGTAQDISERKRAEEALRQMQKMEGLGTLAGGIAHDFNNILGIILAYSASIERSKSDTKKLDIATETIKKAVDRGKTLVQQILTFARKSDTTFGAVNVNDVVIDLMTMLFETFPKILTYSQNFDKAIPFINADRSQLHQALLNLCVNARDAMPNGGMLTVNTHMVSVASIRNQHPDANASSYVCIEVKDTGEGMTEEIRKHIFEPFYTTKGIGKGTGLGLSVVFGVVQSHKGYIDVESEIGTGTSFRMYLPASQTFELVSVITEHEQTIEEIPGGKETLLVVEDEVMLMLSLQMILIDKGYNVLTAEDGFTALKVYQEQKNGIDLVLTDFGLPNITGFEVCRKVKEMNPNGRIILATGYLDPEMKIKFLEEGVEHFLFKPYDLKQVLKEVREVLDKK